MRRNLESFLPKVTMSQKMLNKYIKCTRAFCELLDNGVIELKKKIGKGASADVYTVAVNGFKTSAPLIVKSTHDSSKLNIQEVQKHAILSNLIVPGHLPFLPRLFGVMMCKDKRVNTFMEKIQGTQLSKAIKNMSEKQIEAYVVHVLCILHILQKAFGFVHYDLHLDNVMLVPDERKYIEYNINGSVYKVPTFGNRVVLIDFGYSRVEYLKEVFSTTLGGTGINGKYNPEYDIQYFMYALQKGSNTTHSLVERCAKYFTVSKTSKDYKGRITQVGTLTPSRLLEAEFSKYKDRKEKEKPFMILEGDKVVKL